MSVRFNLTEYASIITIVKQVRDKMDVDDFLNTFTGQYQRESVRSALEDLQLATETWQDGGAWREGQYVWKWIEY